MNIPCRCGAKPLFELGQIAMHLEAEELLKEEGIQPIQLLWIHVTGQWGLWDAATNEEALRTGEAVISIFPIREGKELIVATNRERTTTMIDLRRR